MRFWHTIRELFRPIPFNPIMQPADLVCTHEGSSSCPIKVTSMPSDEWLDMVLGDPRTGVMSFDNGGETVWPPTNIDDLCKSAMGKPRCP